VRSNSVSSGNPANPDAHYKTTGEEIIEQVGDREIDAFVAGVGTGGTISGTGRRLREAFPEMEIVAVEPAKTPSSRRARPAKTSSRAWGPGSSVTTSISICSTASRPSNSRTPRTSVAASRAREEGPSWGQSSGATSLVSQRIARGSPTPTVDCPEVPTAFDDASEPASPETDGGQAAEDCPLVVTVFWDSGERYLSTGLFDWAGSRQDARGIASGERTFHLPNRLYLPVRTVSYDDTSLQTDIVR